MMNWLKKLFGGGRKSETESELSAVLKEQTGDPAFLHRTNWIIAYGKGDFETALHEVNQALQIIPNDPCYLALCAMTHYSMKQYAQAHSYLKQALEKNPAQKEALDLKEAMKMEAMKRRDRARELGKERDFQKGLDELVAAIELEPTNPLNFFFRGMTYAQLGEFKTAVNDVTHTLELDPQYPEGQETLQALKNMAASAA